MMTFYDSNKTTLAIESLGHVRNGPTQIREMYKNAFDELAFNRVTLAPIYEKRDGAVAWATCNYKAEVRIKNDKTEYILETRGAFVIKKTKNGWKIQMEHFSTISWR